jgi:uncharacterized protein YyaL (SSP411 family)
MQRSDIDQIEAMQASLSPDFDAVTASLKSMIDQKNGGFPRRGSQPLTPQAWKYLLLANEPQALHMSLDPALHSPIVDMIDGGFFRGAQRPNWHYVTYDKLAVQNAEMAETLALAGAMTHTTLYTELARWTVGSLDGEFVKSNGLLATCREGDENDQDRSARSSFPPVELRQLLPDDADRAWVRKYLGLMVETNYQMTPYIADDAVLGAQRDRLNQILPRLNRTDRPATFSDGRGMCVNATVAARMEEIARLWNDTSLQSWSSSLFDLIDGSRSKDQVPHSLDPSRQAPDYLGDYLAYADAGLQDYLATGRVVSLQTGLAVLRRGLFLFHGAVPGEYVLAQPTTSKLMPQDVDCPEVLDNVGESCTAKIIRLCDAYGRLLIGNLDKDGGGDLGLKLIRIAQASTELLAAAAPQLGADAAGYDCAALGIRDNRFAVTVGANAQELGNELFRQVPTKLVAPALGLVRADLQSRKPGIYVVDLATVTGPLSVDQAARLLSAPQQP